MKTTLLVAGALSLSIIAVAAEPSPLEPGTTPLQAEYTISSGVLGDERSPTRTDRKLSSEVRGQAAKDIFDSIYPDPKVTCSGEQGERLRRKGHVWCSYMPANGYRCFIGVDLRSGDSIAGGAC